MKKLLLTTVLALGLPSFAFAASYKLPDGDAPIATVTIPDAWSSKAIDNGVDATSDDGSVYVAIEVTNGKDLKDATAEAAKFLASNGVSIDETTAKQTEGKINGLDGVEIAWSGKDKDGPTNVSLSFIAVTSDKLLLLTYWATPDGEKKNAKELGDILSSINKAQ